MFRVLGRHISGIERAEAVPRGCERASVRGIAPRSPAPRWPPERGGDESIMVRVSRRSLLRGGVAAAFVPLTLGAAAAAVVDVGAVTRAAVESAVGTRVRIFSSAGVVSGTLDRVVDVHHAPAGHPHAFSARFLLDADDATALETGLVDLELATLRVSGAGLLVRGIPGARTATLLVDRRTVDEHLAFTA